MEMLEELISQYRQLLDQERKLDAAKEALRGKILDALTGKGVNFFQAATGTARRGIRYKLLPKREPVLALLGAPELFPFAQFSATKVKELLLPKYGRDALMPLFDAQKTVYLQVKPAAVGEKEQDYF